MGPVITIAAVTFRELAISRWVIGYLGGVALISVMLVSATLMLVGGIAGVELYGRLGVTIVAASLMLSTLISISLPALTITGDAEGGVLHWFLARPVTPRGYLIGRFLGIAATVAWATAAGYAASAWLIYVLGLQDLAAKIVLMGVVCAASTMVFSAMGTAIAVFAKSRVVALAMVFAVWLYLNLLHPLTLLFLIPLLGLGDVEAYAFLILSPVEAARVFMYALVDPNLTFLGPVMSISIRLEIGWWIYAAPAISMIAYLATALATSLARAAKLSE